MIGLNNFRELFRKKNLIELDIYLFDWIGNRINIRKYEGKLLVDIDMFVYICN